MKNVKSHTLNGMRWKFQDTGDYVNGGLCQAPHIKNREMWIPLHGTTVDDLDVILHESLHACFWNISEEDIDTSATNISRLLWRLGWRKVE